ncbi:hypothetical protein K7432_014367 [Basidiobolus ranarum]|uniref:SMP-LTD domain-containing protein n=1 Tax=Basidiobolus ranarum TaxID=34480 RepID=A0ABR2WHQ1_9FUNG
MAFLSHLLVFLLGGVFLAPILLVSVLLLLFIWLNGLPHFPKQPSKSEFEETEKCLLVDKDVLQDSRVGWLRITTTFNLTPRNAPIDFSTILALGMNNLLEGKRGTIRDLYYVILSRETMWLYPDEKLQKCLGIIDFAKYTVSIYPNFLPDNEIFHKDLPIRVRKRGLTTEEGNLPPRSEYFIFAKTPVEKEDWFLAFLRASRTRKSRNGTEMEKNATDFDHAAIYQLIRTVHSDEHHLQTQWLNAFLGRVFLSIYKTQAIKDYFIRKIVLKSSKVKKPSFLGDITVRDLHVGDSMPTVTNPKLIDLQPNGEMTAEFCIDYSGGFSVEVETEATISVTARLKPLKVNLVLAVTLKKLSGRMHLKVKPPPTNRFWLGFCEDPDMSLNIEPIVSDKQLKFGMVIQAIERRIHDMVHEALVLPNMDDYPFFPSHGTGGIFDDAPEPEPKVSHQESGNPLAEPMMDTTFENDRESVQSVDDLCLNREEFGISTEALDDKDDMKSMASSNESMDLSPNYIMNSYNDSSDSLLAPPKVHLHQDKDKERDQLLPRTSSLSNLREKGAKHVSSRDYASSQKTEVKQKREKLRKKKSDPTSPKHNPIDRLEVPSDKTRKKRLLPNLFGTSNPNEPAEVNTSPKINGHEEYKHSGHIFKGQSNDAASKTMTNLSFKQASSLDAAHDSDTKFL